MLISFKSHTRKKLFLSIFLFLPLAANAAEILIACSVRGGSTAPWLYKYEKSILGKRTIYRKNNESWLEACVGNYGSPLNVSIPAKDGNGTFKYIHREGFVGDNAGWCIQGVEVTSNAGEIKVHWFKDVLDFDIPIYKRLIGKSSEFNEQDNYTEFTYSCKRLQ